MHGVRRFVIGAIGLVIAQLACLGETRIPPADTATTPPTTTNPPTLPALPPGATQEAPASLSEAECLAPPEAYSWSYQRLESDSGTGGTACSGWLVFTNNWTERVDLILLTSFDNGAMHLQGWHTYGFEVGQQHEEQVSRSVYQDGDVTYRRVDRVLAIRDVPGCLRFRVDSDEVKAFWESRSQAVEEVTCP